MAKNIYDLFNERKNGIEYLVEGYDVDVEDAEPFEDLDAAAEALENFNMESTNELLELQAASYLEDLVIENMIFDDFDEDKIEGVMEGKFKEKANGLKEKVMGWWKKIKAWFASAYQTVINFFQSGEKLVNKYRNAIGPAMSRSNVKVKMNKYKDLETATKAVEAMCDKLKSVGQSDAEKNDGKAAILSVIGADDKADVKKKVRDMFIEKEKVEMQIKDIDSKQAIKYVGNKKAIISSLKVTEKRIDTEFKQILSNLKGNKRRASDDAGHDVGEKMVANFHFAITVKNTMLSTMIGIIRKACGEYTAIIKKVLSGKVGKEEEKEAPKAEQPEQPSTESFGVEFLDDNDDDEFNW